ncbi:TetR/AcrR family transcriptional regulator [Mesorhizobium microcysteis]|uniref:TetR/AcrR family transcriptional regulator n=1 Tax=Neoaquamicrobium microcysteis TaxID=2682781 RepID=A0A5D4H1M4_9HYPH|nr:TetR/AcrR family transcriptional regulator [Mesorhizobium microcysteis]TYR33415.1 TetR/AcrR family transcriptional regulator [Mesorhizobium microcysteis]
MAVEQLVRAKRRKVSRLPAERRIADIMAAAGAVFAEKGYQEALISDIAERAGVVEGSIYRFFANKRELLVRVVEDWYQALIEEEEELFASMRGTWNQLRFIIHRHLLTIRRDPALSRLVFQELRPDPGYRGSQVFELNRIYTHKLTDVVRAAIETGEFRADASPSLVRDMVYGCIEHRTWSFLRNEGDFDLDNTADGIADMIYRGLVSDRAKPPDVVERLEEVAARLERAAGSGQENG